MTNDEMMAKIKQMYELRKQIKAIQIQRTEEEKALSVEYKVDECNKKRFAMSQAYQAQVTKLSKQIYAIEDELG